MTVINGGFLVRAKLSPDVPEQNPAPDATRPVDLDVRVQVFDEFVRQGGWNDSKLFGFDGLERVFAMVPEKQGGQTVWKRHELQFEKTETADFHTTRWPNDHHTLHLDKVDRSALSEHGVAIGMDTNVGTLWMQRPHLNFGVEPEHG